MLSRLFLLFLLPPTMSAAPTPYRRIDYVRYESPCTAPRYALLVQETSKLLTLDAEKPCIVRTGLWRCPYTGHYHELAEHMHVDHLVPLSRAHEYGGHSWNAEQKLKFGRDPLNLWLVDAKANNAKGNQMPSTWLPPEDGFKCTYLRVFAAVAVQYQLALPAEQIDAIREGMLKHCP